MARIHELIRQVAASNPQLAEDLRKEAEALTERRSFGLNFERHTPEAVELPGRPVRRNDKVRVLPPRGSLPTAENKRLWRVASIEPRGEVKVAQLVDLEDEAQTHESAVDDLVVVAEFRDPIYPGLVSTGRIERGGDKPFHTVINAENYHALQLLLFTHRGKVDVIYIDPPYNTGARDWKYNNDYVDSTDNYRHSKWLAFMERRLILAKELLKPDGVLIVAIDENEHARLVLLLEQVFPSYAISSICVVHNPRGVQGDNFSYTNEFAVFAVPNGQKVIAPRPLSPEERNANTSNLRNWGGESLRENARNCFYPIFVKGDDVVGFGDVADDDCHPAANEQMPDGVTAVWPIDESGVERKWRYARQSVDAIRTNLVVRMARNGDTAVHLAKTEGKFRTVWQDPRYDASTHGSQLVTAMTGRQFPFPKSVYAVYDALYAAAASRPNAVILDFFAGSGTTLHAALLLNTIDGGRRSTVLVTNNEIEADLIAQFRRNGLRRGDAKWEEHGIFSYVTQPRCINAISGTDGQGESLNGQYKAGDLRDWSQGFEENAEFLSISYETSLRVSSNREFTKIAPLLWMRAGSCGRCIDSIDPGWDVAEVYGVITDFDKSPAFLSALIDSASVRMAFIITDEDRVFEAMVRELPDHVEPVRLYEAYLRNFEIEAGRPV